MLTHIKTLHGNGVNACNIKQKQRAHGIREDCSGQGKQDKEGSFHSFQPQISLWFYLALQKSPRFTCSSEISFILLSKLTAAAAEKSELH